MIKYNQDLISIIVPMYNMEKYIARCIDSLLAQTYSNIEVLLIDDGSPDKTRDICDKYVNSDKRVKYFYKENGGLSSARNFGLKKANGSIISFVDSDDWVDKTFIEILYKNLIEYNADISICSFIETNDRSKEIINNQQEITVYSSLEGLKELLLSKKIGSNSCNKLFKKKIWNNLKFPEGKNYEDIQTTYRLFDQSEKIVITNARLYYYYERPGSITHSINLKKYNDFKEAIDNRSEYLEKKYKNELKNELDLIFVKNTKMLHAYSAQLNNKELYYSNELEKRYKESKKIFRKKIIRVINNQIGLRRKLEIIMFMINRNFYYKIVSKIN